MSGTVRRLRAPGAAGASEMGALTGPHAADTSSRNETETIALRPSGAFGQDSLAGREWRSTSRPRLRDGCCLVIRIRA